MNTFSHVLLGSLLNRYITEKTGVRLKRGSFILGNILPDFKSFFLARPHYPDSWTAYLQDEIEKLTALRSEGESIDRDFSKQLGVICHFYTDFFCFAHTLRFQGGTLIHMKYEWSLFRYSRRNDPLYMEKKLWCESFVTANTAVIVRNFEKLQQEYMKEKPSFENDLSFSFQSCAEAIMLIINASLKDETEELPISGAVFTLN